MTSEPPFALVDTKRAREQAQLLFQAVRNSIVEILPLTADIRHVGATAVEGCLTKGDVDIVVRVSANHFSDADAALASRFSRNSGSTRTDTFSAFEDASCHPHAGIQLTIIDGPYDVFHRFVELLKNSPQLLQDYNSLKRLYEGADIAVYRAAKDAFIERALASQH